MLEPQKSGWWWEQNQNNLSKLDDRDEPMENSRPAWRRPAANPANAGKCVLIVEDAPLNMRMFSAMVAAQGHRVLQATDGSRGLDLAHQEHPDLIIMDVQLPGLSGLEVTHLLKGDDDTRDIPIIVTSGYLIDEEELRASGCDAYLAKPITVSEFVDVIESFLIRSARASSAAP